jgi:hypothetical protein
VLSRRISIRIFLELAVKVAGQREREGSGEGSLRLRRLSSRLLGYVQCVGLVVVVVVVKVILVRVDASECEHVFLVSCCVSRVGVSVGCVGERAK